MQDTPRGETGYINVSLECTSIYIYIYIYISEQLITENDLQLTSRGFVYDRAIPVKDKIARRRRVALSA